MDLIYDAAAKFLVLEQFKYHFVVSQKRKLQVINLNFIDTDFFHIAGLHYLTDIVIPQDRTRTMDEILIKHTISDQANSDFWRNILILIILSEYLISVIREVWLP